MPETTSSYHWINALKGIAMLLVMMIHSGADKELSGLLRAIGNKGSCGVVLFFLISGFLLYKSLSTYFCKTDYSLLSVLTWIKKKMIRFIPLFYLAVIYGLIEGGNLYWLGSQTEISSGNIVAHFFFMHGLFPRYCDSILGVEWYLGVLSIFICIVPLLFKYFNSFTKTLLLFLISIFIAYYANQYLHKLTPFQNPEDRRVYGNWVDNFGFFVNFPCLCLGGVLYYVYAYVKKMQINKRLLSYTLLLLCGIFIYGNLYNLNHVFGINESTLWAIPFAVLMISQMVHANIFVCNKIFQVIGQYSWPIYLFHWYLLNLYKKYNFIKLDSPYSWGLKFFVLLILSLGISVVLVNFFEKPVLKLLLRDKKSKAVTAIT